MADNEIEKNSNMSNEIKDQEDRLRFVILYLFVIVKLGQSAIIQKILYNSRNCLEMSFGHYIKIECFDNMFKTFLLEFTKKLHVQFCQLLKMNITEI
jgi:hypothetical protein